MADGRRVRLYLGKAWAEGARERREVRAGDAAGNLLGELTRYEGPGGRVSWSLANTRGGWHYGSTRDTVLLQVVHEYLGVEQVESPQVEQQQAQQAPVPDESSKRVDVPCTCVPVPPEYHTTHYGATDPATTHEWDPSCPQHRAEDWERLQAELVPAEDPEVLADNVRAKLREAGHQAHVEQALAEAVGTRPEVDVPAGHAPGSVWDMMPRAKAGDRVQWLDAGFNRRESVYTGVRTRSDGLDRETRYQVCTESGVYAYLTGGQVSPVWSNPGVPERVNTWTGVGAVPTGHGSCPECLALLSDLESETRAEDGRAGTTGDVVHFVAWREDHHPGAHGRYPAWAAARELWGRAYQDLVDRLRPEPVTTVLPQVQAGTDADPWTGACQVVPQRYVDTGNPYAALGNDAEPETGEGKRRAELVATLTAVADAHDRRLNRDNVVVEFGQVVDGQAVISTLTLEDLRDAARMLGGAL